MSATPQPQITPDQYLEMDRAAEFRSEYYNGYMYAMSGARLNHVMIAGNLAAAFRSKLHPRCIVGTNDMRTRISPRSYMYPDVFVVCGKPQLADKREDILLNPTVIIEILSPSTEAYDRGFKFHQYQLIESLQEYALVSQKEPRVEIFHRQPSGDWLLSDAQGVESKCRFKSVDCEIELAAIYENITFDPAGALPPERDSGPR